jgi:hypothetical protein
MPGKKSPTNEGLVERTSLESTPIEPVLEPPPAPEPAPEPLEDELEAYSRQDAFVFRVPGFRGLQRVYQDEFRREVRRRVAGFKALRCLPKKEKQRILPKVKGSIAQVEAYEVWQNLLDPISDIFFWPWMICLLALVASALAWLHVKNEPAVWWIALIVGLASLALIILYYWFVETDLSDFIILIISIIAAALGIGWLQFGGNLSKMIPGNLSFLSDIAIELSIFALFSILFLSYLLLFFSLGNQPKMRYAVGFLTISITGTYWLVETPTTALVPLLKDTLIAALLAAEAFSLLYVGAWFLVFAFVSYQERLETHHFPEDDITFTLSHLLVLLETEPAHWTDAPFRERVIYNLTWIEKRFHQNLYSAMSMDPSAKNWLRTRTHEIAESYVRLAQEVILPQENTHDRLIKKLATDLVNAVDRNWGKFERVEVPAPLPWWTRTLNWVRSALFISLPFLVVIGVEFLPLRLDEVTKNSIITAAVGFGVLNILSWLDPEYSKKLGDISKLPGMPQPKQK